MCFRRRTGNLARPVPVVSAETVGKDMALSVSTLEFFADRQPVEFGMTACRCCCYSYYDGLGV